MGLFSFLDRFNNFNIVATNVAFIYITLKKKYGTTLNEEQLGIITAFINMQYYFINNIYKLSQVKVHKSKLGTDKNETDRIVDVVETINLLIFMEQFKKTDMFTMVNTLSSQKERIRKAVIKVQENPEPNTRKKRSYLSDIESVMTSDTFKTLRKEIGIEDTV